MAGGNRKMNLKKQVRKIDTRRSYAGTTTPAQEDHIISYLDNSDDTLGIWEGDSIIEEVTYKAVTVEGYDSDDNMKENIPIVTGVSAIDLPYSNTIIIVAGEANIMGEYANTLCSDKTL